MKKTENKTYLLEAHSEFLENCEFPHRWYNKTTWYTTAKSEAKAHSNFIARMKKLTGARNILLSFSSIYEVID